MSVFEKIAEDRIVKAIAAGDFNDLSGSGKPLLLEEFPFEPPEDQLSNHILKMNGFTPPWIALRREILEEISLLRSEIAMDVSVKAGNYGSRKKEFEIKISDLNRRILDYNLQAPSERFHMICLDARREMKETLSRS